MGKVSKWSIEPSHTEIAFKVKHIMVSNVLDTFNELEGNIDLNATLKISGLMVSDEVAISRDVELIKQRLK